MTGHIATCLNLMFDNAFRTPWLAAKLLSTDKVFARSSAKELMTHLATTRPGNHSFVEIYLCAQKVLWQHHEEFSKADLAVFRWGNTGNYKGFRKFSAPRVFGGFDPIFDAAMMHARW